MPGRPQHSDATHAIGEGHETRGLLTREDQAKLEIGRTDVPRWLAVTITGIFLLAILAVPISQAFRSDQALDIFRIGPSVAAAWQSKGDSTTGKLFAANAAALKQINAYEDALEDASWMRQTLIGPVTAFQVRCFGVGNEEAYIGKDGWLFYRPDVDHVMGPGFLEEDRLALRAAAGNEYTAPPQPDPRKAIIQFRDQLADRGIELIVMPVPAKPTVQPNKLRSPWSPVWPEAVRHNRDYAAFIDQLRAAGVNVFDPTPTIKARIKGHGHDVYLRTDTHWAPETMQRVAAALAEQLAPFSRDPERSAMERAARGDIRSTQVTHLGDIAVMLEMPEDQTLFAPEIVSIRQVSGARSTDSPVLLLGDSFTNIYAMEGLGWGTDAGLAEQLAYELGEPIDVIAINAGGAHAARQALVGEMARGNDRLAGKRVVIWQFAARELSFGDWKLMALPTPPGAGTTQPRPETGRADVVTGTVAARTDAPRPGSVPYRDAIISIRLTDVKGGNLPGDLLVYAWGLRDNKPADAAWRVGRAVKVKLTPWAEAEMQYGSYNRFELDDPDALFLDAYWGEVTE